MRIDVCAGEKREDDRAEASDIIDRPRQGETYRVPGDSSDNDLK